MDNEALIDAQVAAYRERDLERFLSSYADDATVRSFDGSVLMDRAGMRAGYGQLLDERPDLNVTMARRIVLGDYVIDSEEVTATVPDRPPSSRR